MLYKVVSKTIYEREGGRKNAKDFKGNDGVYTNEVKVCLLSRTWFDSIKSA